MEDIAETIAARLEELGVRTPEEGLQELAAAYPALTAWMRMAEELAQDEDEDSAE